MKDFVVLDYLEDFIKEEIADYKGSSKKDSMLMRNIKRKAYLRLSKFITRLRKDPDTLDYAKMLILELEYIRKAEKDALNLLIENKTGQPAGGSYTLEEIGEVMGLTRERVRQIEQGAIGKFDKLKGHYVGGVLCHPLVSRQLRRYIKE